MPTWTYLAAAVIAMLVASAFLDHYLSQRYKRSEHSLGMTLLLVGTPTLLVVFVMRMLIGLEPPYSTLVLIPVVLLISKLVRYEIWKSGDKNSKDV